MSEIRDTVATLESAGIFQGFEQQELERIAARGETIEFQQGAVLFRQGDRAEGFHIGLGGSVRIIKTLPHVGDEAMAFVQAGDFFGEMALIDDMPRSASAVAHEDCRVFILRKADFLDLTYSDPALGCKFLWALCRTFSRRLRETTDRFATLFAVSRAF